MFRRLTEASGPALTVEIDGMRVPAQEGDTVAAAMLASDHVVARTSAVSGTPRAPFCMMGVCFDCLVTIDGVGNRQACMTAVRQGMRIDTGRGKRQYGQ
jgi:predicted molibdopterin-dependent oxidoreductase YjgC